MNDHEMKKDNASKEENAVKEDAAQKQDPTIQALKEICFSRAGEIYGPRLPSRVSERIYAELESASRSGVAETMLGTYRVLQLPCFPERGQLNISCRGSLGASFLAYLCGFSPFNPIESDTDMPLVPAFYYEAPLTEVNGRQYDVYLSLGEDTLNSLQAYLQEHEDVHLPERLLLFPSDNLTLLDRLERETGEKRNVLRRNLRHNENLVAAIDQERKLSADAAIEEVLKWFPSLDNPAAIARYLEDFRANRKYPTMSPRRQGRWMFGTMTCGEHLLNLYAMITYATDESLRAPCLDVESVYEVLFEEDEGRSRAFAVTMRAIAGILTQEDGEFIREQIRDTGFPEIDQQSICLPFRAECITMSLETMRLLGWFVDHGQLYCRLYEELTNNDGTHERRLQ